MQYCSVYNATWPYVRYMLCNAKCVGKVRWGKVQEGKVITCLLYTSFDNSFGRDKTDSDSILEKN